MEKLDIFGNAITVQFSDIMDVAKFIDENRHKQNWRVCRKESSDWDNNCDFDKAYNQMVYGYKYSQKLMDNLSDFRDADELGLGGLSMDVEGSAYDMGAVVQGVPECCIADTAVEEKKHLRLVASVGFNSGMESEYIVNRGVAIADLAGSLMLKGYIVDLDFLMQYNPNAGYLPSVVFFVRVPQSAICASTIAFLTSSQFLRKICIGVSDFILEHDVNGSATGFKSDKVLEWCKDKSLYFEDGYDIDDNSQIREMYATPEKSRETVKGIYEEWVKKKGWN